MILRWNIIAYEGYLFGKEKLLRGSLEKNIIFLSLESFCVSHMYAPALRSRHSLNNSFEERGQANQTKIC